MKQQNGYLIEINGIQLYGYHGVFIEEQTLGQKFEIDATIKVSTKTDIIEDDPNQILSYVHILNTIEKSFFSKKFKLIESVAQAILNDLSQHDVIQHATIRVKKLNPPIPIQLSATAVVFEKHY